jgi:hypothetical protein
VSLLKSLKLKRDLIPRFVQERETDPRIVTVTQETPEIVIVTPEIATLTPEKPEIVTPEKPEIVTVTRETPEIISGKREIATEIVTEFVMTDHVIKIEENKSVIDHDALLSAVPLAKEEREAGAEIARDDNRLEGEALPHLHPPPHRVPPPLLVHEAQLLIEEREDHRVADKK